jgi:hypothetical protein
MSTIISKNSSTPGSVPLASNLVVGELSINTADLKLYALSATDDSVHQVAGMHMPINGADITSGMILPTVLGTGTTSSTTVLYGNNTWAPVAAASIAIGAGITGGTANSVLFAGSGASLAQDNVNFNYNATTHTLTATNLAGAGAGITNLQSANLVGNIPESQVTNLVSDLATKAPLASPTFIGTPTAPTATVGTSTTQIATTAFVLGQGFVTYGTAPVTSVASKTGAVSLVVADVGGAAPLASPTFTGVPAAPTPATADNSTTVATTAYVHAQGYAVALVTTAGTYTKVTVTAQGLVSAGTTLVNTDIPKTLDHTWITDFDTEVRTSRLDQMALPTAVVNMNGQSLSNVATPVNSGDATNKSYVDGAIQGLDIKASCLCATTGNISLTGLQAIDGYTTKAGDRVLVKNQTTATQNGIYAAAAAAWTRTPDFTGANVSSGAYTFVEQGTTNASSSWVLATVDPITVGTTALVFTQFSGAGTYRADGNGIILTGNTFSLKGVPGQISIGASGIGIDPTYTGQTSITTLGNITNCTIDCGTF